MNGKQPGLFMSVAYFVIGFSPITALAIAIMGILPLPVTTLLIVTTIHNGNDRLLTMRSTCACLARIPDELRLQANSHVDQTQ